MSNRQLAEKQLSNCDKDCSILKRALGKTNYPGPNRLKEFVTVTPSRTGGVFATQLVSW